MIKRILAISDIHGCYDEFNRLLGKVNYDSTNDDLVLVGDYVDRGKDNKKVVELVKDLVVCGAVALRGNHDQMFLDYVKRPHVYSNVFNYLQNGGETTLRNYVDDFDSYQWHDETYRKWANEIMTLHSDHIEFLDSLNHYHEKEEFIFVHAGINPHLKDWKFTTNEDFIWIREQFLNHPHEHEKVIVHGHTPCKYLHNNHDIFFNGNKIGIDGACAYGGQLNCLVIEFEHGYNFKQVSVSKLTN